MKSKLFFRSGKAYLQIEDQEIPFYAYTTYFTERAAYEDFAAIDTHLYSLCTYFTKLPINELTGFTPARKGIFEEKGHPDYSEFDADVADLLRKDPKAKIFPRIYLSMPLWWVREHPEECSPTNCTEEGREILFSERFRQDGIALLKEFYEHIQQSDYANAMIGYQIAGGQTQEWMYFDGNGCRCAKTYPAFRRYLQEKKPESLCTEEEFLQGACTEEYWGFSSDAMAETVDIFCRAMKSICGGEQIIGAFYGYSLEVTNPGIGTHSLNRLLDCPAIDFLCSPFSYGEARQLGIDLAIHSTVNSVLLHGKAYIMEADIRTHLTRYPDECRPDMTIKVNYRSPLWLFGTGEWDSVCAIRRAFAKILTGPGGLWWFDMWGGWYRTEGMMQELRRDRQIMETRGDPLPEMTRVAILIDEKLSHRLPEIDEKSRQREFCKRVQTCGVTADIYVTTDFSRIRDRYPLFFLPQPSLDPVIEGELKESGKPYCFGDEISREQILEELKKNGVSLRTAPGDVFYEGNGYLAVHAVAAGTKTVTLPRGYTAESLNGHEIRQEGNSVFVALKQYDTALLLLQKE